MTKIDVAMEEKLKAGGHSENNNSRSSRIQDEEYISFIFMHSKRASLLKVTL